MLRVLMLFSCAFTRGFVTPPTPWTQSVAVVWARRTSGSPLLLAKKKAKKSSAKRPTPGFSLGAKPRPSERVPARATSQTPTARLWQLLRPTTSGGKAVDAGVEKVAALLRAGADVGHVNEEGYTPLHEACREGMHDVAALLLEAGADAEAVGGGAAARPLHLAALGDHSDIVELLLANGAAVDRMDGGGIGGTALMYAANAGSLNVIDALLRAGASVEATSRDGRSVLRFASFCANASISDKLLAAGAPPLPLVEPWERDRPPLQVLGDFELFTEVEPRTESVALQENSLFSEHSVLHYDSFAGGGTGGEDGGTGLAVHRFLVHPDDARGSSRPAGTFDASLVLAAAVVQAEDSKGALVSNAGGYHSAATLRGRKEDPTCKCWGELHAVLDAAAAAAIKVEGPAGAVGHAHGSPPPSPTCCPPVAHLLPTCCLSVAHLLLAGRLPHLEKGDRESLTVTDTWVNINRGRGDFNKLHSHVPAAYSGVYYAQPCSSGAGRLNGAFVLPISTVEASKGVQSEIAFSLMQPVRGMLLLFPATMLHAVLPSWTQGEERISIGFNVSPFW